MNYPDDFINKIILGDCLEVMKDIPDKSIDLLLTDPPYGINIISGGGRGINGWKDYREDGDWDKHRPTKEHFDAMLRVGKIVVIWGGNYFTDYLSPSSQWFVWDKGQRNFSLADCEFAWGSQTRKASRIFSYSRARANKLCRIHPTQKPVELMKWCIERFKHINVVLDPFVGSGTTAIACKNLGINFIGIEKDKKYYTLALERIAKNTV